MENCWDSTATPCNILAVVVDDRRFNQWGGYPEIPVTGDWVTLKEHYPNTTKYRVSGGTWGAAGRVYKLVLDLDTGEALCEVAGESIREDQDRE